MKKILKITEIVFSLLIAIPCLIYFILHLIFQIIQTWIKSGKSPIQQFKADTFHLNSVWKEIIDKQNNN